MKIRILTLLLSVTALHAAAQYAVDQIPAALKTRANAVIRDMETTVDMRAPNDVGTRVRKVLTVLNKNGREHARLVLMYSKNSSIKYVRGQILNEFGIPKAKFNLSDFEDESAVDGGTLFSDSRLKHFLPNEDVYPYTVIYEYEERERQNLVLPQWLPNPGFDISVEKSQFTFLARAEDTFRINALNFAGKPVEELNDKQKKLTWSAAGLPAVRAEAYGPHPESFRPSVRIAADKFYYHGFTGKYSNWEELGGWLYENFLKSRRKLSPYTEGLVADMVKDLPDEKAKARKLYQYMQQKMRYISVQIGVGGFQPIPAAEVDQMAYGDCKGLVNYMQALLDVAGIESYYCVVSAGNYKKSLIPNFPGVEQGNHVILCLPLKGDTTWLECTSQKAPFGFLGDFTDDRTVLACTPGGGKLLRTPKLTAAQNTQLRTANFKVAENGTMTGSVETAFAGSQYDAHLTIANMQDKERLEKLKEQYDVDNIELNDIRFSTKEGTGPVFVENFNCTLPLYATGSTDNIYLPVNPFNRQNSIPDLRTRTMPLYLNRGYTDVDSIVYHIPAAWQMKVKPADQTIETKFGTYKVTIVQSGSQLIFKRTMQMNEGNFLASDYESFSQFISKIAELDRSRAIFTKGQSGSGK
ncbi:hypothetical protein C7T94_11525 [Pedobacter yulinensis]|uniref:DUF3857 domain-containing protein n=1 Tax=Pedobacter yulinensis TaxID=2126353 RepID=A0A2T3HLB9_9SPHI|nr:DUF3857 domain-containing protein [Pedobacter yulinensis]PST83219.1 hypothetical protein C7T94_11525 [Pedobacter yulinensis]